MSTNFASYLDALDAEVALLSRRRLGLDGVAIHPGLPQRFIAVGELRSILLHPSVGHEARDAAMAEIVRRARADHNWQVVLLAVLAPGIKRAVVRHRATMASLDMDIESEMISAIVEMLASGTGSRRIASSLLECANRRVRTIRRQLLREQAALESQGSGIEPPLVASRRAEAILEAAVAAKAITADQAELITRTHIGEQTVAEFAAEAKRSTGTIGRRRRRAEVRLRQYLAEIDANAAVGREHADES